jgi:predicted transposase/invertase (TIGR01784 family)
MDTNKSKERQLVSFDWAIKRLLRNKTNFDVVEGFLSELLMREVSITSVLESESNMTSPVDKHNRVDISVEDKEGEVILIELQFIPEMDYFQRMLYGVSKTVSDYMFKGYAYIKIKKIYSINIVYFNLGTEGGDDYVYWGVTQFKGLHSKEMLNLSKEQQKIFGKIEVGELYPEYYILKVNNFNDVAREPLDEWIYFLKNEKIEKNFSAKGLLKAREILDYNRLSPKERSLYDYEQDIKSHERSQIATAMDKGRIETEEKYSIIFKEMDEAIKENKKALKEKDDALKEKDETLKEKDDALEASKKALEESKKALEKQTQEIERLKRGLNIE